jgi:predicted tellurium resistance membrane protein TerC
VSHTEARSGAACIDAQRDAAAGNDASAIGGLATYGGVLAQIAIIDIVFSLDSVPTWAPTSCD